MLRPRRNMGPFMALNKRPGHPPAVLVPARIRAALIGFPAVRASTDTTATGDTFRAARVPWRYRA